jgi:hypothetical protein
MKIVLALIVPALVVLALAVDVGALAAWVTEKMRATE